MKQTLFDTEAPKAESINPEFQNAEVQNIRSTFEALTGGVTRIKWRTPEDEFAGVARIVRRLLTGEDAVSPAEVFVCAPHAAWACGMDAALEQAHVKHTLLVKRNPVTGDPRNAARMGTLEAWSLLLLAVDFHDMSAWRLWFALGDATGRARQWSAFSQWAHECGFDGATAIDELVLSRDLAFEGADILHDLALQAKQRAEHLAGYKGFALTKALSQLPGGKLLVEASEPLEGDEDAAQLCSRIRELSAHPYSMHDPLCVGVGGFDALGEASPKHLIIVGLVEGVVDKSNAHEFVSVLQRAQETATLSYPQHASLDFVRQAGISSYHRRLQHGKPIAVLSPSTLLEVAGDTLPGTVSGEQYLALVERPEKGGAHA